VRHPQARRAWQQLTAMQTFGPTGDKA